MKIRTILKRVLLSGFCFLAPFISDVVAGPVYAQATQPTVRASGVITAGHCAQWLTQTVLVDSGAACGGGGGGSGTVTNFIFTNGNGATGTVTLATTTPTLALAPTAGGTFASSANNLGFFATTTSAQLAGIMSDETGSGGLVFATSPTMSGATLTGTTTASILQAASGTITISGNGTSTNMGATGGGNLAFAAQATATFNISGVGGNTLVLKSMQAGIGTATPRTGTSLDMGSRVDSLLFPVGTTGTRPVTGIPGMARYNTTTGVLELFLASAWDSVITAAHGVFTAPLSVTASSATALTATNGTGGIEIDTSAASAVTLLQFQSEASGGGFFINTQGGNGNENMTFNAEGSGSVIFGNASENGFVMAAGINTFGGVQIFNNGPATGGSQYTVSTLPTCNATTKYGLAWVSNNTVACVSQASPINGGTIACLVGCDGTSWKIH